jgi:tetratricopeptide (TPR) repeat protein/transcriptional regulator with XRE-family HTH domain
MSDDHGGFGARLRACRRSAGLSQEELAERSGLSVRTISNLERGRARWPYRDTLRRLADALDLRDAARAEFIGAAERRLGDDSERPGGSPAAPGAAPPGGEGRGTGSRVVPRQLPAPVPAFAGRSGELAALSEMLHRPGGTAVITAIGGTAGVGKTALAVHWAHQVIAEFPDGQLFVNLRGFDPSGMPVTPEDAVRVLLEALDIPADQLPRTAEAQQGLYRSLLAGKRVLLVLDNASDEAQVRPLLPGSLTCRVVVTSRNQLTGLVATEAAQPLLLGVMTGAEARSLLRERLGQDRISSDTGATDQIISSSARLPLALCIIAARAAMRPDLPLARVAADLAAHPELDAFTAAGDPAADVRTALSWSYRQLTAGVARAFRMAGLHPGPGFERYAVAALTGMAPDQAGEALGILARGCLIQPSGPGRYGMHDLLRRYAGELAAAEDGEQDRRASLTGLFDYYLHTAAAAMDTLFPAERHRRPGLGPAPVAVPAVTDEAAAQAWLDVERPNLVAATVHAAGHGWAGHAITLSATLFRYLSNGSHAPEAIVIHGSAYRAAREAGDRAAEAHTMHDLGAVDLRQGRYRQAVDRLHRALEVYREVGDLTGQARLLANLGVADLLQGNAEQAVAHFQRSLDLHRQTGDRIGQARALGNLGFADLRQGRYEQAIGHLEQSLALCRATGDRGGEARALANIGEVELRQGRHERAAGHLRQALDLCRAIGDQTSEADILASLGAVDLQLGRYSSAIAHQEQALALVRQAGDLSRQALTLNGLGAVLLAAGRPAQARTQHAAALRLASQTGERYEQARAHDGLANGYRSSGSPAKARRHWQEALDLYTDLGAPEADHIRAQLAAGGQVSLTRGSSSV